MKAKYLIKGVIKSIPGIEHIYNFHRNTGGTDNARYCYSVWLRHLIMARESGMNSMPRRIAELGPGDSLGIGLSVLISGAEHYSALDIVRFSNVERNLKIFDELVTLFKTRSPIPDESEFPNMKPALNNYNFPGYILTDDYLEKALDENRLQRIRNSIKSMDNPIEKEEENMIQYRAPWNDADIIESESIDMIISQAVLQHVDDLEGAYKSMFQLLKKGGVMSHTIDFKCMDSADTWDGHWAYSDLEWKVVRGRKSYLINREPYSTHIKYLNDNGFKIIYNTKVTSASTVKSNGVARRFKFMAEEDFKTSGAFIQAIKKFLVGGSLYFEEVIEYVWFV